MNLNKISKICRIDEKETKKAFRISLSGLLIFVLSFFVSSCNKNGVKEEKTSEINQESYNIEKTTSSLKPAEDLNIKKNCGPTPGYPCGTKYYTVSVKDFGIC